jgi:hypothetical protein
MSAGRWTSGGVPLPPARFMMCDVAVLATGLALSIARSVAGVLDLADDLARAHANATRDRAEFKTAAQATIDLL